jgi:hypothetical protein
MSRTKVKPGLGKIPESDQDDILNLKLSTRTYNALRKGKITSISELAAKPVEQLSRIRWLGKKGLHELKTALSEYQSKEGLGRSLYQCFHAKVKGTGIRCAKGHSLSIPTGTISIQELMAGKPLVFEVCQKCADYDEMGPAVPPSERGWSC